MSQAKKMKRQRMKMLVKQHQSTFEYHIKKAARQALDSGRGATLMKFESDTYMVTKDGRWQILEPGEVKQTGLYQGDEFIPFFEYSIEHGIVELRDRR